MTVIRFKIGDAFPASDPVARFITGLAMISNDWLRSVDDMFKLEDDTPEEVGRRISLFHRQAALVHEAATFITDARRLFPHVASFIEGLDVKARDGCERVIGAVDGGSPHYLGDWLERHRNVIHHYPKMHPAAAQHGQEEMATALTEAADIESTIDSGQRFGDARFRYADEVGVQLLPSLNDPSWMDELRDTAMALADFAQRAAQAYLETQPAGAFTVEPAASDFTQGRPSPPKHAADRRTTINPMRYECVQRIVSAACFPVDTVLSLRAGPGSAVPLEFINYETDYGSEGTGELVCHVRGDADDLEAAAVTLTNSGNRNLQLLAVAANAAVLSPHIQVVYDALPGGRFAAFRTLGDEPQVARRMIDVDRALNLIQAFERHPKETRLLRAAENYGESMRRMEPVSSVHALLHLWMAVENLTVVVAARLMRDHDVGTMTELGESLGVKPRGGSDRLDDRDVQGLIRRREVFNGDDATHKALREASDGIEHGYLSFGEARELVAAIFERAAAAIRRSILSEAGLADEDVKALTTGIYTRPLPLWRPRLVAVGHFAGDTQFDFRRPVHMRVNGTIRTERIEPEQHATTGAVDAQVRTFDGLAHTTEQLGLDTPGEPKLPPANDSGPTPA